MNVSSAPRGSTTPAKGCGTKTMKMFRVVMVIPDGEPLTLNLTRLPALGQRLFHRGSTYVPPIDGYVQKIDDGKDPIEITLSQHPVQVPGSST